MYVKEVLLCQGGIVQWLARSPSDWKIASSNPGHDRPFSIFF